VNDSTLKV